MNPTFPFMIFIFAFLFWLLCSFVYTPLGKICKRLWDDAMKAMGLKDDEEK